MVNILVRIIQLLVVALDFILKVNCCSDWRVLLSIFNLGEDWVISDWDADQDISICHLLLSPAILHDHLVDNFITRLEGFSLGHDLDIKNRAWPLNNKNFSLWLEPAHHCSCRNLSIGFSDVVIIIANLVKIDRHNSTIGKNGILGLNSVNAAHWRGIKSHLLLIEDLLLWLELQKVPILDSAIPVRLELDLDDSSVRFTIPCNDPVWIKDCEGNLLIGIINHSRSGVKVQGRSECQ